MSNAMFKGIMPALITPFENGKVKEDALRKLTKWQLSEGVDGFYICGTTGEGPVLRTQTRMQTAEIVVDETKGKGVVIDHIGAPNIEDALELTKHATDIKVDAIASLPPTYFFKYTEDELFDYYKLIADNTDLPVLVYATGMMGSVNVVRLMERVMKLENVIGVKCTIRDYFMMRKIKEVNGGDINLINGPDETLLCGLTVGADGGIGSTYNLMPDWFSKLYEAYASGDLQAAQDHQFQINRVIDVLLKYGVNGVNKSLKAALEMKGFDVGGAAFPAKKIEGAEKSSLKKDLENLGIKFEGVALTGNITGMVSDSQRFSLHDGPGIRTTIYLKGCNMTCIWCHNPESIDIEPEIAFYKTKCISCGSCYKVCPTKAIEQKDGIHHYDKSKCLRCYSCIEVCPSGALTLIGREMSVDEVLDIILADKPYYKASGGGMTLSGGEPLLQVDFALELLKKSREADIDTAIETNMSFPFDRIEKLLPYINRIFCDIKSMNDVVHKKTTSVSNKRVLENIKKLSRYDVPLVIRTPLIPGITDGDENIKGIAEWIRKNTNAEYYELLNYNVFAKVKYENILKKFCLGDLKPLTPDRLSELKTIAEGQGLKAVLG